MRILILGTDKHVFDPHSDTARRLRLYGAAVESIAVCVPLESRAIVPVSANVTAYGSGGKCKWEQWIRMVWLAWKKSHSADVISSQDVYYIGLIAWLVGRLRKKGVELQVHGWEAFSGLRRYITTYILPRVAVVRTVGQRSKERLIALGVDPKNILIIPVALPPEMVSVHTSAKNGVTFFTASRLVPVKHVIVQLRALAQLSNQEVYLRIAGDGPQRHMLECAARELGISGQVVFLGWVEPSVVEREYLTADAFVFTSLHEGWGRVVLEAARKGLPIVSTPVGCVEELFTDEHDILLVSTDDVAALATAMGRLVEDPKLRETLGRNARYVTQQLLTEEEIVSACTHAWKTLQRATGPRILDQP